MIKKAKNYKEIQELKEYSLYLLNKYKEYNTEYQNSGFYFELKSFYEDGKIQDLISKNDSFITKKKILNILCDEIRKFCKDFDIDTYLYHFDEYIEFKKLNIDSDSYNQIKKYNL